MGIMDMFRSAPQVVTPAQSVPPVNGPAVPGNIPPQQAIPAAIPGTGTVPNNAVTNPPEDTSPKSPLDQFTDLFKIDPAASNQTNTIPTFNVDQAKLFEAAKRNDFSKVLSPEILEKIAAGGAEAQQAMMGAMNLMSQKVYADSAFATTQIVEQALKKQAEAMMSQIPGLIKNQNLTESLRTENPIFAHPAAEPMLQSLQAQIQVKFPQSTVTEQKEMAQKWLLSFAQAANPTKAPAPGTAANGEDWSAFFE